MNHNQNMKFQQLSECQTLIARFRNLLEERGISIPPSIQGETEKQLGKYEKYLNRRIESQKKELEEDLESVKRTIELLRERGHFEDVGNLQNLKNEINREIQELSTLDGEDVLADPEWT